MSSGGWAAGVSIPANWDSIGCVRSAVKHERRPLPTSSATASINARSCSPPRALAAASPSGNRMTSGTRGMASAKFMSASSAAASDACLSNPTGFPTGTGTVSHSCVAEPAAMLLVGSARPFFSAADDAGSAARLPIAYAGTAGATANDKWIHNDTLHTNSCIRKRNVRDSSATHTD